MDPHHVAAQFSIEARIDQFPADAFNLYGTFQQSRGYGNGPSDTGQTEFGLGVKAKPPLGHGFTNFGQATLIRNVHNEIAPHPDT